MAKYIMLTIVLGAVILGAFLYSGSYLPGGDSPGSSVNYEIPYTYPEYLFPIYDKAVVNEVIEGEEESVTISFLSKESKEELKLYYEALLRNAYQISEEDNSREYSSMGMKSDYIYSISVISGSREYNNEDYNTSTTIGVMPLDEEFKQDMDQMTEKEKEIMLIWFKALNEMDK
ncbi:MAG: hypothetical protein ABR596_04575 [Halarsenatibacteraceae bacterium]